MIVNIINQDILATLLQYMGNISKISALINNSNIILSGFRCNKFVNTNISNYNIFIYLHNRYIEYNRVHIMVYNNICYNYYNYVTNPRYTYEYTIEGLDRYKYILGNKGVYYRNITDTIIIYIQITNFGIEYRVYPYMLYYVVVDNINVNSIITAIQNAINKYKEYYIRINNLYHN